MADSLLEDYRVRAARRRDIARVALIDREAFETAWSLPDYIRELSRPGANIYVLMCRSSKSTVAYLNTRTAYEDIEILRIATDARYQRRGCARRLLNSLIEDARHRPHVERLLLEVRRSNRAALGLYEQLGFRIYGARENYYGGREDALLLELIV